MSFTMIPLQGTWVDGQGAPRAGVVTARPLGPMVNDGEVADTAPISAPLNASGSASLAVRASNDPGTQPETGTAYEIRVELVGSPADVFAILVPYDGGPVDLTEAVRLTPGEIPAPMQLVQMANQRGVPGGYPSLGPDGLIPADQLPAASGGTGVATVNGESGHVVMTAAKVGAAPASHTHTPAEVGSVAAGTAVLLSGAQTIDGVKTFTAPPVVPAPVDDAHAATKAYVDAIASGGVDLSDYQLRAEKDQSGGYVGLDGNGLMAGGHIPYGVLADIKAAGSAGSAGVLNSAARGDHAHPYVDAWMPEDVGLVAWTSDPAMCQSTAAYCGVGTMRAAAVVLHSPRSVSRIVWYAGLYTGGLLTGSWAGIFNSAGNRVAGVADLSAAGSEPATVGSAGGAMHYAPLDGGAATLPAGVYTIAWRHVYNSSTPDGPMILQYENAAASPPNTLALNSVRRFGINSSPPTSLPATLPALSSGGNRFWAALA